MFWGGVGSHRGVDFGALVKDSQGDIQIIETYLSMGRLRRQIGAIIDSFLDQVEVVEVVVEADTDFAALLEGHKGEVWLTGPCLVRAYVPDTDHELGSVVSAEVAGL
jgi:hypothetical protein